MEWQSTENIKDAVGQILVTDGTEAFVIYASWLYRTKNGDLRAPAKHGNGINVKAWAPTPKLPLKGTSKMKSKWDTETIKELVKRLLWHYPHSYSVCNTIENVANEMLNEVIEEREIEDEKTHL